LDRRTVEPKKANSFHRFNTLVNNELKLNYNQLLLTKLSTRNADCKWLFANVLRPAQADCEPPVANDRQTPLLASLTPSPLGTSLAAGEWLWAVVRAQEVELLHGSYRQADETKVPVQTGEKAGRNHRAYFWEYSQPGGWSCLTFKWAAGARARPPS
jgi:hypothetical protein